MMKFIDREMELDFLEKKYRSNEAEMIILYGRRRIGKTEMLLHFAKKKRYIYFLGRLESREDTLKRFNASLIEFFKDFNLVTKPLTNWDEIFNYLAEKTKHERIMLIFDEYPFVLENFPEINSVLQDKWDSLLKKTKIMLILSGSSISMMEKHTLEYKSPLYGRRTGQWLLEKLNARHLKEFYPDYSVEDILLTYSCLDTIPGYLVKFLPDTDVWGNIEKKLLSKGEFLYEEVEVLLREEFRDPSNYMSILSAISGGSTTFGEIHSITKLDKSLLSKYLYILERLGVINKIIPVTESYKSKLKARGALYFLKDNFFDFWFRFVYLNKGELEGGKTKEVLTRIKNEINTWLGRKFEQFVADLLPSISPEFPKIGRWWHKDKEIDIVALNENTKQILFCECKWQGRVNAKKILAELKEKSQYVQWNNDKRKEHYAIFAKSFREKIKEPNLFLYDLKDLQKQI